jgi:hypothetical protein
MSIWDNCSDTMKRSAWLRPAVQRPTRLAKPSSRNRTRKLPKNRRFLGMSRTHAYRIIGYLDESQFSSSRN